MAQLTIAISTSTAHQLVGVRRAEPDATLVLRQRHWQRGQPRTLLADIEELLGRAGGGLADVERIICDVGPGSFTGLRFGLATARAMAWALSVPTVGVGSLRAMQAQVTDDDERAAASDVVAALPSRRGVVYARYSHGDVVVENEVSVDELAAHIASSPDRRVVAPSATLESLGAATGHNIALEHPSLEALLQCAAELPHGTAASLLPVYGALSQPERLAAAS